jgi:hypothetical protein
MTGGEGFNVVQMLSAFILDLEASSEGLGDRRGRIVTSDFGGTIRK